MGIIKIMEVLRSGLELYKKNFSILFKISVLYTIVNLFNSISTLLYSLYNNEIIFFVNGIVSILSIYLMNRLLITATIIVRDIVKLKDTQINSAFAESSQYFWRYIGNTFLVSIPVIIPTFLAITVQRTQVPLIIKLPQFIVLAIVAGVIASYLYFAPASVALEPNLTKRLRYSFRIVKGKMIKVFTILLFSNYVFLAPVFLISYINPVQTQSAYFIFTRNIISSFIYLITMPFSECVGVILFYKLRELKNS